LVGRALRFRRIATSPVRFARRKSEAKRITAASEYADFIDSADGYRLFSSTELPGVAGAVSAAARLFESKKAQPRGRSSKPFFANICEEDDLDNELDLLEFAKSQAVFEVATDYLKTLPRLTAFGVYYSPENQMLAKSQLWHVDDEDFTQIKCFINVHPVDEENGPFTFIPAQKSDEIRRKLNHQWRGGRVDDDAILAHCKEEDIVTLTGEPGSAAFVDTCRCLHFGSRARRGHRLVMMFKYSRTPDLHFYPHTKDRRGSSILLTDH
jgi:hypothetical protein